VVSYDCLSSEKLRGEKCHSVFLIRTRELYKANLKTEIKTPSNNRCYSSSVSPQADTHSQSVSRTGEQWSMSHLGQTLFKKKKEKKKRRSVPHVTRVIEKMKVEQSLKQL